MRPIRTVPPRRRVLQRPRPKWLRGTWGVGRLAPCHPVLAMTSNHSSLSCRVVLWVCRSQFCLPVPTNECHCRDPLPLCLKVKLAVSHSLFSARLIWIGTQRKIRQHRMTVCYWHRGEKVFVSAKSQEIRCLPCPSVKGTLSGLRLPFKPNTKRGQDNVRFNEFSDFNSFTFRPQGGLDGTIRLRTTSDIAPKMTTCFS